MLIIHFTVVQLYRIKYNFAAEICNDNLPLNNDSIMQTFEQISPREAYAAYMLGSVVVDVRESEDIATKAADLKQMIALPFSQLDQRLGELPTNRQVVFVSRVGIKSKQAAELLIKNGFDRVATIQGGLHAWEAEGLPIRRQD